MVGAQHRVEGRVVGQAVQWELGAFQRAAVAAILHPHQSLTARDLQLGRRIKRERLQASSGAISGAVKWLTSVGLVERVPAPASRRDHYRLRDNAWAIQYTNQNEVTSAVLKAAEAGIAATEDGSPAVNVSRRCATFTTSCSRRFRRCSTVGISNRGRPRRSPPSLDLVGYLESS